jgi:hypothetical protein
LKTGEYIARNKVLFKCSFHFIAVTQLVHKLLLLSLRFVLHWLRQVNKFQIIIINSGPQVLDGQVCINVRVCAVKARHPNINNSKDVSGNKPRFGLKGPSLGYESVHRARLILRE